MPIQTSIHGVPIHQFNEGDYIPTNENNVGMRYGTIIILEKSVGTIKKKLIALFTSPEDADNFAKWKNEEQA